MSIKIQSNDYLENTSQEKIDRINKEIPSKLASMFYISKANRVSYYSTNSWGDLMVWNKGVSNWEHCPSMLDKELYTLPAKGLKTESVKEEILPLTDVSLIPTEENSEVEITKVTVEPELEFIPTKTNTTVLYDIDSLYYAHLPPRYFIGLPPDNENAYSVQFEPKNKSWSVWIREPNEAYLAGTRYTNSWSCAEAVANYLTSVKATPEQLR